MKRNGDRDGERVKRENGTKLEMKAENMRERNGRSGKGTQKEKKRREKE